MPDRSEGFCVAITEKGIGRLKVSLSIVTVFSSIDSRKALCVFGLARFNSSARTIFVNIGPLLITNSLFFKNVYPIISLGNKSDVN